MRFLLTLFLLISMAVVPGHALAANVHAPTITSGELFSSIDELAAKFDPAICGDCHEQIFEEWSQSAHSKTFIDPRVIKTWRTWLKQGADKETMKDWDGSEVTRMSIKSHCMWCHAPAIKYATDELVADIVGMVLTAAEDPKKSKREAAIKQLSKLNLNCYGCHNMFALKDGYWANKPEEGAIYGPRGEEDPEDPKHADYKTIKSEFMATSNFCAKCHHGCPDSVPLWQCRSLYSSYKEDYIDKGLGTERCQDCHMKPEDPDDPVSHRFPGANDKEFFAKAIEIDIEAEATTFINDYENELTPTLCLNVKVDSRSGHGIPNG